MERLRAALLGCLLAGGAVFGARPLLPEDHAVHRTVYAARPGSGGGRTPEDFARWVSPLTLGACLAALVRGFAHTPWSGRRCSSARLTPRRRCR
jgi:hypothetical protein